MPVEDLTGRTFGKLTVVEKVQRNGRNVWKCVCDCPKKTITFPTSWQLTMGGSRSCGCRIRETHNKMNLCGNNRL